IGRSGNHVLEEFLVAGSVNNNVLSLLGVEPNLGRVDGNILVALGLERIHQIGPLERNAAPLGDLLQLLEFSFGQRAGVVKKPSNKRGLPVVNVSNDDDF